jgi:hypothetical protein
VDRAVICRVVRRSFGGDLYTQGSRAVLHPTRGDPITAAEHLRRCVAIAHNDLVDHVDDRDRVHRRALAGLRQGSGRPIGALPR